MRKIAGMLLLVAFCMMSCKKEVNQEELVGNAAKQYYTYLLEGKYDDFVAGCFQKDSIRDAYREQLVENAKMFVGQQKKEHNGIEVVELKSVELDTAKHAANVFLILSFGDKTTEQIVLPMVQKDNLWYMK